MLTGNYLYQQPDADNTFTRRFEHIASVHFRLEEPQLGRCAATCRQPTGYLGQSDLWRRDAMPFFNATEQAAVRERYTFLDSDGTTGCLLATYENRVVAAAAIATTRAISA